MLKVWLPLDGDLRNLGTDNITFIQNTGATIVNEGKIGQCYSFDGNDDLLQWRFDKTKYDYKPISVACWFKCDKTRTGAPMVDMAADLTLSYTYSSSGIKFGYWRCYANASGTRTGTSGFASTIYDADVWHHVAVVFGAGKETIYVDGQFSQEINHTHLYTNYWHPLLDASYNKITLAKSTGTSFAAGTNFWVGGLLNDVRIYDHALSAAEVHEIAQGLVLHYKLDANSEEKITTIPSTNVYSYPTFNTSTATGGWHHWGPSGHSGSYGQNTDKKYIYNKNNTYSHWITEDAGTGKYYLLYQSPAFEGGYRSLQAIIKEENGLPITESICCPGWNARDGGVPNNKWTSIKSLGDGFYYCCCEGISQNGSDDLVSLNIMPGYKIYVSECYLEDNVEKCSPIFTYSSNIVQDSSGYGHNGTIIGDLILNNETPRYSTSTKWNCSSPTDNSDTGICYIQTPFSLTTPLQLTFAWWAKPENGYLNTVTHAAFCTSSSASRPTDYTTTAFHHRDAGFDICPSDGFGVKRLSFSYTKDEWHHYAVTYDGTTAKSYKDGTLQTNVVIGTNKTLASFSQLYIGYSQAGSAHRKTLGSYSDFRIYCTALLDTDIQMLYNMGMKVDNLGGVHTFEYKENTSNLFRSELIMPWAKANRTRIGEIVEHNGYYAMNIAPEPFYKNISDSVSGFLQGHFYANTSYIFDLWIDVDSVIVNGNNAAGGLYIIFSDGSSDNSFVFTGGNKGWQHKKIITPSNKTIDRLSVYYYTSTDVFYRLDSYICPISSTKIIKQGILDITNITENSEIASIYKGGSIYSSKFIEM